MSEEGQIISKIRAGERVEHFETTRRRKDGSFVDVSLTVSPIKDGSGKVIGASKIARDISARKASELEIKLARDREDSASRARDDFFCGFVARITNAVEPDLADFERRVSKHVPVAFGSC